MDALKSLEFPGPLYAVNLKGEPVRGFETVKKLSEIPDPPDHVIVTVPAGAVMPVLEDCEEIGARSVTVFTSGFSETGDPEGIRRQKELRDWLDKGRKFRLIGPNCMGLYCPESGLGFRLDFPREPGDIGFVSQSGGMTITGVVWAAKRGLHFSKVVSYGNEVDLSCPELLHYLAEDEKTKIVWVYIEGTSQGDKLARALEAVADKKPLLVLKGGRTEGGERAAASHTGSMAGSPHIWEGLFKKTGAVSVSGLEGLIDGTQAIEWLPRKHSGKRLGIFCISGGLSVNFTDLAIRAGFSVPPLSEGLKDRLQAIVNLPGTSVNNPLDLAIGFFAFDSYPAMFQALDESGEIDIIVLVMALEYFRVPESLFPGISKAFIDGFLHAARSVKRLVVVMPPVVESERLDETELLFLDEKIPVFRDIERALAALDYRERGIRERAV